MPSHLTSIGIGLTSTAALEALAERVIKDKACEIYGTSQGRYFRHRSPCGAELWLQADRRRRLMGVNPHFSGPGRVTVGLTGPVRRPEESELDGAMHGWAAPEDAARPESGLYPLVFDVPDAARHLGLGFPRVEPVQVAAFAHELTLWPDEAAYLAAPLVPREKQSPGSDPSAVPPRLAVRSFIPTGLFAPSATSPTAEAVLTGVVLGAERLTNELTGDVFWWLLVESLGGTFDVVADPELVRAPPAPGAVVQGAFWLSGRLVDHDLAKRTWLDRIRNR